MLAKVGIKCLFVHLSVCLYNYLNSTWYIAVVIKINVGPIVFLLLNDLFNNNRETSRRFDAMDNGSETQ